MAKPSEIDRVKAWDKRIVTASKTHRDWSEEFDTDQLEQFYYGHQWATDDQDWDKRKYVINLFYPAINISKPSLLFGTPKYAVRPRPSRSDDPLSNVEARAKLQETTLNTCASDPRIGFEDETGLAVIDAMFRFGVLYVGYTADFIDNPNAGKPILNDKQEAMLDSDGAPVPQPAMALRDEALFLKWIPAKQFLAASNAPNRLQNCDWCGYYEWHRIDDIKANKRYKNTSGLKATGRLKDQDASSAIDDEERQQSGMVKLWFIWDNRGKKRLVFAQGGEKFLMEESFSFLPFAILKFNERPGKFYPLPETYNWVHPQRELNDTREMQRLHRKRAVRRYRRNGSVTQEEFDKLVDGEDMVCIETPHAEDITPIQDAPLDSAVARNIPQSQDDFTRVSGISGEAQEVAQSETATQANLIALASKVREASRRKVVARWLADLGRVMLLTMVDKMALPVWIKKNVDPESPLAMAEAMEIAEIWSSIEAEDLGSIDNDITVDITSLSPVAQEQERAEWMAFLQVITNPTLGAILAQSPSLLRKTAGLFNMHNERDLVEIQGAMQKAALLQAMTMAQGTSGKASGGGIGPGPTPSNPEIAGQLSEQLPVEVTQ